MKMDSASLKFDPQVIALAMPTESGYTKAAEGIGNLGKVFQDQEDRAQTQKLNALKMEEANQSIIGKKNENTAFAGEQTRKVETHRELQRKAKLDFDMLNRKNTAEIKTLEENGVMDKLSGTIQTPDFFDGKTINIKGFNDSRALTLKDPKMAGKEHIVNAMYDKKFKELNDLLEGTLKNGKTSADTNKLIEETKVIVPKANAYIATQGSVVTKNLAGANLDNVNASLAPVKTAAYVQQTKAASKNAGVDDKLKGDRLKVVSDAVKMEALIPNYSKLTSDQKMEVGAVFYEKGVIPKMLKDVGNEQYQAIYPAGSLPKKVTPTSTTSQPKVVVKVGEIKTNNSTGQKAQWDGHGWVLIK